MVILTLNCGSSSAKYQVYDWEKQDVLAVGIVERVTQGGSFITHRAKGKEEFTLNQDCPTHVDAVELIIKILTDPTHGVIHDMGMIKAVGHRVVHGGSKFTKSVIVTDEVLQTFREVSDLAPLHNPANIMGIEAARKVLPSVPHCAIMDTAWHQTMPASSYIYALPAEWHEKYQVRRYGFHGTSFLYTSKRAAVLLGKDFHQCNLIIAHLGNGASINAVKDGCSFDTSMGLSPLEGLVMGSRCGDIDPAIPFYMMRVAGLTATEVENMMNKKSGLLGLTGGRFTDRRDIQAAVEKGDKQAELAQDVEAYRVKKYIGAYMAALGRVDALVFTAGAGEMAPFIRKKILAGLEPLGIVYDPQKNEIARTRNAETNIAAKDSKIPIFIIPTDEELVMTEDAYALMKGTYDIHTRFTYTFQKRDYVNKSREEALQRDLQKNPALASIIVRP
ncbi:MAG TPA: acetate kinase [Termitinemataceae bacterium]|jgi:acetate kinase|uniref:acetate kinase n=1 Tax=Treponema sp. J25 TaxID=2094121 RepID=UPI001043931F|nr:acetate kinase [Treponema sp. J25]TCW60459.1 propionate kinase [Treponema sp. J25]HOJ98456.1 acetate kinase [Termitinemataceae bacterium]HOM22822.1 acetate kinase [Termitinemataceae bacterium]HPP99763.1 acetate kinase [Termitinemataceae bacterium]